MFSKPCPFEVGDNTSRAVIVLGESIGSAGEIPCIPPVIRALMVSCPIPPPEFIHIMVNFITDIHPAPVETLHSNSEPLSFAAEQV